MDRGWVGNGCGPNRRIGHGYDKGGAKGQADGKVTGHKPHGGGIVVAMAVVVALSCQGAHHGGGAADAIAASWRGRCHCRGSGTVVCRCHCSSSVVSSCQAQMAPGKQAGQAR